MPRIWRRKSHGGTFHIALPLEDEQGMRILRADGHPCYRNVSLRSKDAREARQRAAAILRGEDPFERRTLPSPLQVRGELSIERVRDAYLHACEHGSATRRKLRPRSLATDVSTLRDWFSFVGRRGHREISSLTVDDVRAYLDSRHEAGDSPRTNNRRRFTVSAFFAWTVREQMFTANPVDLTIPRAKEHDEEHEPARVRYFSREEWTKIAAALAERAATCPAPWAVVDTAAWVARYTGARLGELAELRYEHFDWAAGILDAPVAKTKRRRIVELHPKLIERYAAIWGECTGFVIVPPPRWRRCSQRDLVERVCRLFGQLLREIGVGEYGLGLHALRHTFASEAILEGVPIDVVAQWLGHGSTSTTYRYYSHLLPRSSRQVSVRWWDRIARENGGTSPEPRRDRPE